MPLLFTRCIQWLTPLPRQCPGISAAGAHRRENIIRFFNDLGGAASENQVSTMQRRY
jgi:hypothetical protein